MHCQHCVVSLIYSTSARREVGGRWRVSPYPPPAPPVDEETTKGAVSDCTASWWGVFVATSAPPRVDVRVIGRANTPSWVYRRRLTGRLWNTASCLTELHSSSSSRARGTICTPARRARSGCCERTFRSPAARVESSIASPPHRRREEGLAQAADTSITSLAPTLETAASDGSFLTLPQGRPLPAAAATG
jgi:hypothetical protein